MLGICIYSTFQISIDCESLSSCIAKYSTWSYSISQFSISFSGGCLSIQYFLSSQLIILTKIFSIGLFNFSINIIGVFS